MYAYPPIIVIIVCVTAYYFVFSKVIAGRMIVTFFLQVAQIVTQLHDEAITRSKW